MLSTSRHWMLQNIHHLQTPFWPDFRSVSKPQHSASGQEGEGLLLQSLLVCLPRNPTRRPRLNRSLLLQTASSTRRFRLRGMFLQRFHRDTVLECGLVCGVEEDLRHDGIILPLGSFHRLLPPRRTQAPLAARFEPDRSQIVAARGAEVEEFFGEDAGNGVVSAIFGSHPTVAVTVEARHGFLGEEGERLFEDIEIVVALFRGHVEGCDESEYEKW